MKILFVIGNGFDLQLGLPTRYSDFYEYYKHVHSPNYAVEKLKSEISSRPENWSDLELSLGAFSSSYHNVQDFCDAYDDIQSELQKYLLTVDSMLKENELQINADKNSVLNGLLFPEKAFSREVTNTINGIYEEVIGSRAKSDIIIQVLTFNYTHTIECFSDIDKLGVIISQDQNNLSTSHWFRNFSRIVHIHRDLRNGNSVWLGVDNEEQISKETFRSEAEIRYRLIKPDIIEAMGSNTIEDTDSMINKADIICLFGVSLGDTDLTWVKKIGNKVAMGVPTLLFIADNKPYMSDNAKLVAQQRYKKKFLDRLSLAGVITNMTATRIYVEINSPIFTDRTPNHHDENLQIVLNKFENNNL